MSASEIAGVEIALSTAAVEVADDFIASFRPGVEFRTNRLFFSTWRNIPIG